MNTPDLAPHAATMARAVPMTSESLRRLEAEAHRLAEELAGSHPAAFADALSGDSDAPTFVANGELHLTARRLEKLRAVIGVAQVVEPDGRAVVGNRVRVSDGDGFEEVFLLVAPGEAEPKAGHISPESPLGAALLGTRAGQTVEVSAPSGSYQLEVLAVE